MAAGRLTWDDVREIREILCLAEAIRQNLPSQESIALRYGVSTTAINRILQGHIYKDAGGPVRDTRPGKRGRA